MTPINRSIYTHQGDTYIWYGAVLEIMVGHLTFSDQTWCLSEHVLFWSGIMSNKNWYKIYLDKCIFMVQVFNV